MNVEDELRVKLMIAEARIVSLERELATFTHRETLKANGNAPRQVRQTTVLSIKQSRVMKLCGGFCFYCDLKLTPEIFTCDHLIPVSKGGGNGLNNLVPSCSVPLQPWRAFDSLFYCYTNGRSFSTIK